MKKIYIKILTCIIIALCAISTVSMPVSAATISPYSYYEQNFSFKGTCSISKNCTGMWLDVKVRATASNNNNETITLEVYVANRNATKTYKFLSDGQTHEFKGIYLGLSGGSNVLFSFTGANPEITINTYMEAAS